MQEQVDHETIALSVKTVKLTGRALAKAMTAALRQIQKQHQKGQTPQGRQSVKKLMNHRAATDVIPLDGDTRLFDKVARKWEVDYAFRKTGPDKYLLLFKSGQAGAITSAFSEYTALMMERAKDKRPPLLKQLAHFKRRVKVKPPRERERVKEAARDER